MMTEHKKQAVRLLFLITTSKLASRAERMFEEDHIPVQYRFCGQGTASSEMMDMLGLSGVDKSILMCMLPKVLADELLRRLRRELKLGLVNTGVAFTVPISGASGRMVRLIELLNDKNSGELAERNETEMAESDYSMILAIVNQGYSEDVMNAARPVGASGGTAIHSRRVGSEVSLRFWGITIQPEREIVVIIAQKKEKLAIMKAIGEKCGMQSDAHGIVLSLPVDAVAGME